MHDTNYKVDDSTFHFSRSASLLRGWKTVLNTVFDFIYKKLKKPNLPHFADHFHKWTKRKKVFLLNKSKMTLKTTFGVLSKLAEQAKIHLLYYF